MWLSKVRFGWGRGLTHEAVAAVIRYGFSVLGLHRIEAGVLPGNDASGRVLQKLGFLVLALEADTVMLVRVGSHEDIRRFLRSL